MEELIKLLDENIEYVDYSILGDTIYINVISICESTMYQLWEEPNFS